MSTIAPNPMPELAPLLKRLRLSGILDSLETRNREAVANKMPYTCSRLQSSSVLLANIGDFCSDYLQMTEPEYSRSLRTCSHCVRRTCNHRLVLTLAANDPITRSRSRVRPGV